MRGLGSSGGVGVGVTLEVGSARVKAIVKIEVEGRKKFHGRWREEGKPNMSLSYG